jgi:hypothetical protein
MAMSRITPGEGIPSRRARDQRRGEVPVVKHLMVIVFVAVPSAHR